MYNGRGETTIRVRKRVTIPQAELQRLNDLLKSPQPAGTKAGDVLKSVSTDFGGGWEADVKICNGDPTPWVDASLFLNGHEVMTLDPGFEKFDGDYFFPLKSEHFEFWVDVRGA